MVVVLDLMSFVIRIKRIALLFTRLSILLFISRFGNLDFQNQVYKDQAALENHKESEHFKAWVNFNASGAVIANTVSIYDAVSFTNQVARTDYPCNIN